MARYLLIPTCILLALSVASCNLPGDLPTSPPPATAPPAEETSPPPTESPGRYINTEGQFSLLLPEGWQVLGPFPVPVEDGSPYNLYVLGANPSESGGPGDSRIIVADAAQLTVERFVELQCPVCPQQPIEDHTLGGVPARRVLIGGGSVPFQVEWVFVENAGKLIGLSIHDAETLESLEAVLESFGLE